MSELSRTPLPLWRLYEHAASFFGIGSLVLLCLCWLPFALLLQLLPRRWGQSLARQGISFVFRIYLWLLETFCACRFDLTEIKSLRREPALIIAANHPSLLDAVILISCLPNAVCVMKASLMNNFLLGSAARPARYIRNSSIFQILGGSAEALNQGGHLVLFPEGSRTRHFPIDTLLPTLGMVARRAKVPVQTVLLDFSTAYLGKGWPWFRPAALPLVCRARLGQRFEAPGDHTAFTAQLEAYFRREVRLPKSVSGRTEPL